MNLQAERTAFLFPGQGSQTLGMGRELCEKYPIARTIFEQADDILGLPLSRIVWEGPEDALNDTVNTQPALLVHSVAALRVFEEQFPTFHPGFVAGHSMGELSALVAAGALTFEDTLRLVRVRGESMKKAGEISPGGMAAILGLDIPTLENLCYHASTPEEVVQVANDNCPGQVVISGASAALERAMELAVQAKARKVVRLNVSIPAHSPLMAAAQADFNAAINASSFIDPEVPIIGNVNAAPLTDADQIRDDLRAQLNSRVRWTESISNLVELGITHFIEIGNGAVLVGLLKRIHRDAVGLTFGAPTDLQNLMTNLRD